MEINRAKIYNFEFGNHYITIGIIVYAGGKPKNLRPDDFESLEWFAKDCLPENLFKPAKQTLYCYINNKFSEDENRINQFHENL